MAQIGRRELITSSAAILSAYHFSKGAHVTAQEKTLHIDIPVKLAEVKNVFSIASLSFEGDLPGSIFHLQLIMNDIANWKAKSQVVYTL